MSGTQNTGTNKPAQDIVTPSDIPHGGISRFISTGSINRMNTLKIEIGPQLQSFNLPRRLFVWIYSVSLVILMTIWLVLVAVTIIDVIKQNSAASFKGVKLFFVIIICVVFIVIGILLYFSRLYQRRVAMNDIPTKSAYIPFENDMPNRAYRHIDKRLRHCCGIKTRASPLYNEKETINYPGLSPPEYIQERNKQQANLLPPNIKYQEVIHSLSDRFTRFGSFSSTIKAPKHYTFREINIYLCRDLIESKHIAKEELPNVARFFELYEKFRFGPDLIEEKEMLEFMVLFTDLSTILVQNYGTIYSYRKTQKPNDKHGSSLNHAFTSYSTERSDLHYDYSEFSDSDEETKESNVQRRAPSLREHPNTSAQASVKLTPYEPKTLSRIARQQTQKSTDSSQRSIVRSKLHLFPDAGRSTVSFQTTRSPSLLKTDRLAFSRINSHNSNFTKNSGYNSDVEEGSEPDDNSFAEKSEDSDGGVYDFRRQNLHAPMNVPTLVLEPASSVDDHAITDVKIQRAHSPSKRSHDASSKGL